ncbi:hypothetical protein CDX27_06700 [Campylobacter coli]|nr:hypothetical protein [Campylobacter jejuni]EAI6362336.1 hypothetical protein [Campylobacter coli]EAK8023692.1 hypothetical protein [Campylobacter coli]
MTKKYPPKNIIIKSILSGISNKYPKVSYIQSIILLETPYLLLQFLHFISNLPENIFQIFCNLLIFVLQTSHSL